jgi:ATP-dependent Clp protease ATP-binding subunit ClpA
MFERYTEKARRAIFFARYEASQFGSPFIETEHLLLGMFREDSAITKRLSRPTLTLESIRKRIEELTPPLEKIPKSVDLPLSAASKRVLIYAVEEADRRGDKHVGTNHLLLALIDEKEGIAAKVLSEIVINPDAFRDEIGRMSDASWKVAYPQKSRLEDYIEIHGELWSANSIRELSRYYWRFHWEKRRWVSRDALVQRSNRKLHLYSGQSYDPEKFELVKGEWNEDHCAICWWKLCESDSPEHGEGLTNGQDWLCTECYERFLNPKQPADW